MKYLGVYEKKYCKGGMFRLPLKWVESEEKFLYCALCQDVEMDAFFLRFYYNKALLKEYRETAAVESQIKILQCYRNRIIPLCESIFLPNEFCEMNSSYQEKTLTCVGVGNGFEVWYAEDFQKMEDGFEELLDICKI